MQYQPIQYQIRLIAEAFNLNPELAYDNALAIAGPELPAGAKALFAIPALRSLASTYAGAVARMLDVVAAHIPFDNRFAVPLTDEVIRQSDRSCEAWQQLQEEQNGDILIVAAQLGSQHRSKRLQEARNDFRDGEFELGALATGSALLGHPHWKVRERRSWIDTGDEYFPDGDEEQARLIAFARSDNGSFAIDHRPNDLGSIFAGVATGFLR
jgi:hypothetical protein